MYQKKMRRIALFIALLTASTLTIKAQYYGTTDNMFNHLDLGVTLGTTGIGIDAAMPVSNIVKLRTGFEVMPRFNHDMHFDVQSFDDKGIVTDASFNQMSNLLYGMTGFKVDDNVIMQGKPTMWNFKLLVDVYPLKNNKHWRVTAGFHWGPSKIAEAVNAIEDSPSLFAVGMYNHMYDAVYNDQPFFESESIGSMYIEPDGLIGQILLQNGRMGIPVGKYAKDYVDAKGVAHKKGDPYYMEPNENSMVSAEARANSFKPYLGIGYEGRLIKGNDDYHVGFDAGLMFWGGTPSIITHEGVNLSKDVEDIHGKVGSYVDLVKGFSVFPVLNLRITRRIF